MYPSRLKLRLARSWSFFSSAHDLLAGQMAVDANDAYTSDLVAEYENLRPVLASQQNTVDTLKTIALLQQSAAVADPRRRAGQELGQRGARFPKVPAVLRLRPVHRLARGRLRGDDMGDMDGRVYAAKALHCAWRLLEDDKSRVWFTVASRLTPKLRSRVMAPHK